MNDATDITDLSPTIKPKSDQLNADDLLTGSITVKITGIKSGPVDQPVHLSIQGQQPFKPCKTMRRVLITAWGVNGQDWVGKSMTLYCDPSVKFGGVALGGIRISHLSDINGILNMMLTETRGRKKQVIVKPLICQDVNIEEVAVQSGWTVEQVLNSYTPPLKSLDDITDKNACAQYLKNNKPE